MCLQFDQDGNDAFGSTPGSILPDLRRSPFPGSFKPNVQAQDTDSMVSSDRLPLIHTNSRHKADG